MNLLLFCYNDLFVIGARKIDNLSECIEEKLKKKFKPTYLDLIDETYKHKNHRSLGSGARNYTLIIKSDSFNDLSTLKAHQDIYSCLSAFIGKDIHALSIKIMR